MLQLSDPGLSWEPFLRDEGGFAWWYAEVLDDSGTGAVVIWSWGLPFLPGQVSSARRGQPRKPWAHPSVAVSLYENGNTTGYAFHEFDPRRARWDGAGSWDFGESTFRVRRCGERVEADVGLSIPISGTTDRLEGSVRLEGPAARWSPGTPVVGDVGDAVHVWNPIVGPARGSVSIRQGQQGVQCFGRAYFDRNAGRRSIDRLGIDRWVWGHASLPSEERIFYCLDDGAADQAYGFRIGADGLIEPVFNLTVRAVEQRTTLFGMPAWSSHELTRDGQTWLRFDHEHRVDSGPFYTRAIGTGRSSAARGHGSSEVIVPSRIDMDHHRPLVRMRVSSEQRRGSMWLPLFNGARSGRLRRLLHHWVAPSTPPSPVLEAQ